MDCAYTRIAKSLLQIDVSFSELKSETHPLRNVFKAVSPPHLKQVSLALAELEARCPLKRCSGYRVVPCYSYAFFTKLQDRLTDGIPFNSVVRIGWAYYAIGFNASTEGFKK